MNTRFKNGVIHFDYTAQALAPAEEAARKQLLSDMDLFLKIPAEKRTFENTVLSYGKMFEKYSEPFATANFLAQVSPDKELRDAAVALQETVSQFIVEITTKKEIYSAFKAYADTNPVLGREEKKILDDTLKGLKKSGLHLEEASLEKLRELNKKESLLQIKFNKNLRDYKDPLALTREQMQGLEENFISRLERDAEGKYLVTLDYPDYGPFMLNADDEASRRALEFKYNCRGGQENVKILEDVLALRREEAQVLGERNYAAAKLEYRMAKTPENVDNFLKSLAEKLTPLSADEDKKILDFKKSQTQNPDAVLNPWDGAYWGNKYRKKFYDIDPEIIKEYFQSEYVTEQMLIIFGDLFGVKFERADIPVWHKDVRAFKVLEKKDNSLAAYIYMDLFPREGKYKHAACMDLEDAYLKEDGTRQIPFTVIIANFNPPAGDAPSLLKHGEVETLFHEFGHVLHNVLSKPKYKALGSFGVAWDFVETPSQLLENWAWDKGVLKQISKHYKTGEPLPDEMINKMISAKKFGSASGFLKQNFYASYDMFLHESTSYLDTTKTYFDMNLAIRKTRVTPDTIPQAGFGHIIGGYDAGYYGYLWSLVIAQDFFSVFEASGIRNEAVGAKLRQTVFAPGSSYEEEEMVESFLGRKVSDQAFLESLGIDK